MPTGALIEPPKRVSASIESGQTEQLDVGVALQEILHEATVLEHGKLSKLARMRLKTIRSRLVQLGEILDRKTPAFSPQEAGERLVTQLQEADGGAWAGAELMERFGLSAAVLHRRRKEHRLVYWRDARHAFFYPRWQFTETGALLAGIQDVLQVFRSQDEWRVMRYFLGPRQQLGGRRPLDLIRAGQVDEVLSHAKKHAAENTW